MENTKREIEQKNLPEKNHIKESMRVQKTEYVRQQMIKRKEAEDALLLKLIEEQRVIDSLQEEIRDNLEQTEESSKYNQEVQENINAQIYALHGISKDKMEGMREYKQAYYKGCACAMFFLSAALVILCGVLHGFQSEICIFMLSFTGMEGALLTQEKKRLKMLYYIGRLLYLLIFPAMLVMFVCYELNYPEYDILLPYMVIAAVCILILAAISSFLYNPYRSAGKKVRDAKDHIDDIEKSARKEVRKTKKSLKKELKKQSRRLKKEEKRLSMKNPWQGIRGRLFGNKSEKVQEIELSSEEVQEAAKIPEEITEKTAAEALEEFTEHVETEILES